MGYTLDIIPDTRIALYRWVGSIALDERRRNRRRIVTFCQREGVKSVLIDGRGQASEMDTQDAFQFGSEMPREMHGFRVAIVHRPEHRSAPFAGIVATNRGGAVKAFLSIDEARAWLESLAKTPSY